MPMTFLRRTVWLTLLSTLAGLAACTPEPEGVRVDITARADGVCSLEHLEMPCLEAGQQAVARHPGRPVHAVLLIDDSAPTEVKTNLVSGLQHAHVSHIQFGLIADDTSQRGKLVF